MPVRLTVPNSQSLLPVAGVALGVTEAGIRKKNRKDLLVIRLEEDAKVAGVFTQNRFCAAPVIVAREHLTANKGIRALLVNTGNANAGTGEAGIALARRTCDDLARVLGCEPTQVLPFSTGVIMEPLPADRIAAGLSNCLIDLDQNNWFAAAQAIMTTDIVPKATSRQVTIHGKTITITGIAKGSGMIHPNMATMLGFIATDANLSDALVQDAVKYAAQKSFNCITVDGDTSTNDSFVLIATGTATEKTIDNVADAGYQLLRAAITDVAIELAQAIVRDGEGATKFITVKVEGGRDEAECRLVGYAVAHSPLVKTAFFASDPNLGRILAAIGYAGIMDLETSNIQLYLDDVLVAKDGGRNPDYQEADGRRVMKQEEITVRIVLGRGNANVTLWTCDFSYDYVKINADYRS